MSALFLDTSSVLVEPSSTLFTPRPLRGSQIGRVQAQNAIEGNGQKMSYLHIAFLIEDIDL